MVAVSDVGLASCCGGSAPAAGPVLEAPHPSPFPIPCSKQTWGGLRWRSVWLWQLRFNREHTAEKAIKMQAWRDVAVSGAWMNGGTVQPFIAVSTTLKAF